MTPLWVLVARKAADTLVRVLDSMFPMVDPADQARLLAAMEGRDQAPAPGVLGEAHPGAGNGPGSEAPSVADLPGLTTGDHAALFAISCGLHLEPWQFDAIASTYKETR
jgi:hypothetical protein